MPHPDVPTPTDGPPAAEPDAAYAPAGFAAQPLVSPATSGAPSVLPTPDGARPDAQASGSLDQIRSILFGQQRAETDARLADLESLASAEIAQLRRQTDDRLRSLEAFVRTETESLGRRLEDERRERTEAHAELSDRLERRSDGLARRLAAVLETTDADGRALRQQLLDETARARESVAQRADALMREIDTRAERLGQQKADRAGLAALFAELAARLQDG